MNAANSRTPSTGTKGLDEVFLQRRSIRAFSPEPLTQSEIDTLFEAARWAPSSNNSQPWKFVYATDGPQRGRLNSLLRPGNQSWATAAPLLAFLVARKGNSEGRVFRTNQFDSGAAWMSLAIQAARMGIATHAMGGIEIDDVYEELGLSRDEYDVMVGIAIGRQGDPASLADDLREREAVPSDRMPLNDVVSKLK